MIGKQKIRRKLHGLKCLKCPYYLGKIKCVTDPCIECVSSNAYIDGCSALTTEYIEKAIKNTHSLSEIMKESLTNLSKEYENRHFKSASK